MNKVPKLILRFLSLLFVQAFVFDPTTLGLTYAPFVYILLLVLIPNDWPSWVVLLIGFFIGLSVDFIFVSGGIHAAACLVISYARPLFIRAVYSDNIIPQNLNIRHESIGNLFRYIILVIFVHHFLLFSFIVGTTERLNWLISAWFINSLLTILVCGLIILLTRNTK